MKGLIKMTKIDREEIERVIDDLKTKYDQYKAEEWDLYTRGTLDTFDYCIARLKELL